MPESFSDAVSDRIAWRGEFAQHTVYRPQQRPGFAAWGDGLFLWRRHRRAVL